MEWVEPFAFSVEMAFVRKKKNVLTIDKITFRKNDLQKLWQSKVNNVFKVCIHLKTLTRLDESRVYWNIYLERVWHC